MRNVRILEAAAAEVAEAAAWYEQQRPGLGADFSQAIEAALDLLAYESVPLAAVSGSAAARGAKRLILKRFPFDVIVREAADELIIVAFAHHSRRPGYWSGRSTR